MLVLVVLMDMWKNLIGYYAKIRMSYVRITRLAACKVGGNNYLYIKRLSANDTGEQEGIR